MKYMYICDNMTNILRLDLIEKYIANNMYIAITEMYGINKIGNIIDKTKPKNKPKTKIGGKNCRIVAGEPNFLFTRGLNNPY